MSSEPRENNGFKYSLRQVVKLVESGESGTVVGRSESLAAANDYLIRYKAADGRQQQVWWTEEAIEAA
jgi:hypothetical protein